MKILQQSVVETSKRKFYIWYWRRKGWQCFLWGQIK